MKSIITQTPYKSQAQNTNIQEIIEYLRWLTPGQQRALRFLLQANKKFKKMFFSQEWGGSKSGLHRVTFNRNLKLFVTMGIITKTYRHCKTCIYELAPVIKNATGLLKQMINLICFIAVSTLISSPTTPPFAHDATLNKIIRTNSNLKSVTYIDKYTSNINGRSPVTLKKEDFIPEIVQNLKDYNLTVDQKLKLGCFPYDALKSAEIAMSQTKKTYAGLKYHVERYCKYKQIRPRFRPYYIGRELWKDELMKMEEPQKEVSTREFIPRTKAYIKPAQSEDYIRMLQANPIDIFLKQYKQFLQMENHFLPEHIRYTMGVANMVKSTFWSFLGSQNLSTIKILYHIESLMEHPTFLEILNLWGALGAAKFLELCFQSALDGQDESLLRTASRYGNSRDEEKIKCQVIEMGLQLQEFMNTEIYKMMKDILTEEILRNNIYTLINNWIKIAN